METLVIASVIVGFVVGTGLLVALGAVLNGWALSILWGWFIAPLFGLPTLSVPAAIGLALVVTFLTKHYEDVAKDETKKPAEKFAMACGVLVMKPAFAVAIGWVVTKFL